MESDITTGSQEPSSTRPCDLPDSLHRQAEPTAGDSAFADQPESGNQQQDGPAEITNEEPGLEDKEPRSQKDDQKDDQEHGNQQQDDRQDKHGDQKQEKGDKKDDTQDDQQNNKQEHSDQLQGSHQEDSRPQEDHPDDHHSQLDGQQYQPDNQRDERDPADDRDDGDGEEDHPDNLQNHPDNQEMDTRPTLPVSIADMDYEDAKAAIDQVFYSAPSSPVLPNEELSLDFLFGGAHDDAPFAVDDAFYSAPSSPVLSNEELSLGLLFGDDDDNDDAAAARFSVDDAFYSALLPAAPAPPESPLLRDDEELSLEALFGVDDDAWGAMMFPDDSNDGNADNDGNDGNDGDVHDGDIHDGDTIAASLSSCYSSHEVVSYFVPPAWPPVNFEGDLIVGRLRKAWDAQPLADQALLQRLSFWGDYDPKRPHIPAHRRTCYEMPMPRGTHRDAVRTILAARGILVEWHRQ